MGLLWLINPVNTAASLPYVCNRYGSLKLLLLEYWPWCPCVFAVATARKFTKATFFQLTKKFTKQLTKKLSLQFYPLRGIWHIPLFSLANLKLQNKMVLWNGLTNVALSNDENDNQPYFSIFFTQQEHFQSWVCSIIHVYLYFSYATIDN